MRASSTAHHHAGGRAPLWATLAFLWFLFLPQDLAMDPNLDRFSWPGAVFWVVVLVWLLVLARRSWRAYRQAKT